MQVPNINRIRLLLAISCCCFCLTAYGVGATQLIPAASQQFYELQNKVSIQELTKSATNAEEVSYTLQAKLKVNSVWHASNAQLLQFYLTDAVIRAPGKKQRVIKRSITKIPDRPFYVSLVDGRPQKVIAHTSRDQSLLNLERGIASLLQLQYNDGAVSETDVSGRCHAFYAVKSTTRIEKTKTDCSLWDLRVNYRGEKPLSVVQHSKEFVSFELGADGLLLRVASSEKHRIALEAKPDAGSEVTSLLSLKHVALGEENVEQLQYETLDEAIDSLLEWYRIFDIESDVDGAISELKRESFSNVLAASASKLQSDLVGKSTLALEFVKLLPLARIAKQADFVAAFNAHKDLRPQLVDLLGAVQTNDAHNAIIEVLKYDNDNNDAELFEKYLQSLAVGTHPDRGIIEQLFQLIEQADAIQNFKLRDSITQTVATLTRQSNFDPNDLLLQQIRTHLLSQLQLHCEATDAECKTSYVRALQNLKDTNTIEILLQYALTAESKVSVAALQALKSFPVVHFNESHRQAFTQIFYQRQRKYDSTARTLALDIILALKPNPEQLGYFLDYLNSNDRQFEIKTYVIQKLRMLAEKCPRFSALLAAQLAARPKVNNYHVIGQKGLTTVLTRQLSQSPAFNESLLSIQEVYQGILKRGSVELILNAGREETSTFKLGLYTNGLGGIVGDSDSDSDATLDDTDNEADTTVNAGMEISVQGVLLRPLIFFTGQTELMSHVWTGTASDTTPAYQATTLAHDHEHYVMLASGATIYLRILGARSVDLNGKVNFSIWNRNAQTEIQQNSGSAIFGHVAAGFTYAKLVSEFTVAHEPKLSLQADLDFYSGIKLCMQLQRPELSLTHTNNKYLYVQAVQRPYTKRVSITQTHTSPGRTLALNQKNNEMCNIIFN